MGQWRARIPKRYRILVGPDCLRLRPRTWSSTKSCNHRPRVLSWRSIGPVRKLQAVKITLLILPVIVSLVLAPGIDRPGPAGRPLSVPTYDPLGKFEGVGATGNLSWTGDGQRLSNPSFETGLSPWTQSSSNTANGSAITLVDQGYQTNNSAR